MTTGETPINFKPERPAFLYDGTCNFCTAAIQWARKVDTHREFDILPYQEYPAGQKQRYQLSDEAFEHGMYLVDPQKNKAYHGVFAINRFFMRFFPYNILVVLLYIIPIFLLAEIVIYALVARNRTLISCWLGFTSCDLNPRPEEENDSQKG